MNNNIYFQIVPLKNYPGYFVSNFGDVYRLEKDGSLKPKATYLSGSNSPQSPKGKYSKVDFTINGKRYKRYVHQLVLEAFDRERVEGEICLHYNDDKQDNRLDNLRWGTALENSHDYRRNLAHRRLIERLESVPNFL